MGQLAGRHQRSAGPVAPVPAGRPRRALTSALALACGLAAGGAAHAASVQERLGHPASARLLVLHADDFGMSHSVNRATMEALEHGWITSASILVPCPWFPEAARWARAHPEADLGIHLALNSEWTAFRWGPLSPVDAVASLLDPDGYLPLEEETVAQRAKLPDVERELRAQIERARSAGVGITHFDSHMRALFGSAGLFDTYRRLGRDFKVPVMLPRDDHPQGVSLSERDLVLDGVLGIEPGVPPQGWAEAYEKILAPLKPGVYQLIIHLAYDDDEMRGATWDHPDYGAGWRQRDLELVRSARFKQFLKDQGFVLVSWRDLAKAAAH